MATVAETPLAERDYFTDKSVLLDPYAYFEAIRAHGPVFRPEGAPYVFVTGFDEAAQVLLDSETFSSCIATSGPVAPLPFVPQGHDISAQIEAAYDHNTMTHLMVNYDGKAHADSRSLLNHLFTPSKLKANEAFMDSFAEELVRDAVAAGGCDLINGIATPYVTLVIADLLGVPADDREAFRKVIDAGPPAGDMDAASEVNASHALMFMGSYFMRYVAERRAQPQGDVLSELANAKYPDGETPPALEVVKAAMFLFAAGQDTSAKLLGNAMRFIVDDADLQERLRADPKLLPGFLEEVLRLEGSTKGTFRLAKRDTKIGDMEIAAGTPVVLGLAAANRDPRRWETPSELIIGRPRIKEHLGFSRGAHTCIGAPLARVEVRVIFEKFFEQTDWIALDMNKHAAGSGRELKYEASFIIRGLEELNITLTSKG